MNGGGRYGNYKELLIALPLVVWVADFGLLPANPLKRATPPVEAIDG